MTTDAAILLGFLVGVFVTLATRLFLAWAIWYLEKK